MAPKRQKTQHNKVTELFETDVEYLDGEAEFAKKLRGFNVMELKKLSVQKKMFGKFSELSPQGELDAWDSLRLAFSAYTDDLWSILESVMERWELAIARLKEKNLPQVNVIDQGFKAIQKRIRPADQETTNRLETIRKKWGRRISIHVAALKLTNTQLQNIAFMARRCSSEVGISFINEQILLRLEGLAAPKTGKRGPGNVPKVKSATNGDIENAKKKVAEMGERITAAVLNQDLVKKHSLVVGKLGFLQDGAKSTRAQDANANDDEDEEADWFDSDKEEEEQKEESSLSSFLKDQVQKTEQPTSVQTLPSALPKTPAPAPTQLALPPIQPSLPLKELSSTSQSSQPQQTDSRTETSKRNSDSVTEAPSMKKRKIELPGRPKSSVSTELAKLQSVKLGEAKQSTCTCTAEASDITLALDSTSLDINTAISVIKSALDHNLDILCRRHVSLIAHTLHFSLGGISFKSPRQLWDSLQQTQGSPAVYADLLKDVSKNQDIVFGFRVQDSNTRDKAEWFRQGRALNEQKSLSLVTKKSQESQTLKNLARSGFHHLKHFQKVAEAFETDFKAEIELYQHHETRYDSSDQHGVIHAMTFSLLQQMVALDLETWRSFVLARGDGNFKIFWRPTPLDANANADVAHFGTSPLNFSQEADEHTIHGVVAISTDKGSRLRLYTKIDSKTWHQRAFAPHSIRESSKYLEQKAEEEGIEVEEVVVDPGSIVLMKSSVAWAAASSNMALMHLAYTPKFQNKEADEDAISNPLFKRIAPPRDLAGQSAPFGGYSCPISTQLPGVSPISQAILGQRSWEDPLVSFWARQAFMDSAEWTRHVDETSPKQWLIFEEAWAGLQRVEKELYQQDSFFEQRDEGL